VNVPPTIDPTGGADASAALNSWLRTVPDGSTVIFKAGGVYRLNGAIQFPGRNHLTLDGNGATLRAYSSATSLLRLDRNSGTTIRDFILVGNSPTPGVYSGSIESRAALRVYNSRDTEIYGLTIRAVGGDCLYIGAWSDGVRFHDNHCVSAGRMGVAITAGRNVTVERNAFDAIGYGVFDIEPNFSTEGASNVRFVNNTVGRISQVRGKAFLFGANGAAGSVVNGVTVSGNTVTGDSLDTYVTNTTRRKNIVFTNNTAKVASPGPVLFFSHVDYLTVGGNVQPLTSGVLARILDCTGTTYTASLVAAPRTGAALSGTSIPLTLTWSGGTSGGSGVARYELAESRNGGAWTVISTSLTARSANVTVAASGTVRYRVRAVDTAGNAGAWTYGPTLTPRLTQQTSSAVRYSSTWYGSSASSFSGGSAKYARAAGRSATYTFTGRSIALVTTRATTRGKVKIYINGVYKGTVDLYRSSTQYRSIAWKGTWSTSATRTIKIVVVGTSGRPRVDVDAFVVLK
jgi:hypothetical protein